MNFGEQLTRIRRMLRDPDANLWTRNYLKNSYNMVQREILRRTKHIENATILKYPPLYQSTYLYDWEFHFLVGSRFFRCLRDYQQGDFSYCFRDEATTFAEVDSSIPEAGFMFTQPWEAFTGETPGVPVSIKFPENFHTTKMLAWDKWPLEYKPKKAITQSDTTYQTREGEPVYYYREDDQENAFIPYPRPSTVTFEDEVLTNVDPGYVFSQSWEEDFVTGEQFTKDDSDNSRTYIYEWELGIIPGEETVFHGMWIFEITTEAGTSVAYLDGDANEQLGTIVNRNGSLLSQDAGLVVDVLDADDEFLLIYDQEPTEMNDDFDESDFPIYLRKYIEYGVLRDAFGGLTDGKLMSLRDYWSSRFEFGIEAIKRYQAMRRQDRDYRFINRQPPSRRTLRHPSLPSTYPTI